MAESVGVSKAAKKNQKRRGTSKTGSEAAVKDQEQIVNERPVDPLSQLQSQIAQAKADKDHAKAQELRHQLWVLQDTLQLGAPPPSAPSVDISSVVTMTTNTPKSTATGDPTEKKLLKLRKKLDAIASLKKRVAAGEKLEKTQLLKIESEGEVLEEINILEDLLRN